MVMLPLLIFLFLSSKTVEAQSCTDPAWHVAYQYTNGTACPTGWKRQLIPPPLGLPSTSAFSSPLKPGDLISVCTRTGISVDVTDDAGVTTTSKVLQDPAILSTGFEYKKIRGRIGGVMYGSPDSFRPEGGRGPTTLDDAFTDGVTLSTYSATSGRTHVATYGAGLSYSQRLHGYYMGGNCIAHEGSELPPTWLKKDEKLTYCDSSLQGGAGSTMEFTLTIPSTFTSAFSVNISYAGTTHEIIDVNAAALTATSLEETLVRGMFNVTAAEVASGFNPQLIRDSIEPRVMDQGSGVYLVTLSRVVNPQSLPVSVSVKTSASGSGPTLTTPVVSPNSRNCKDSNGDVNTCTSDEDCEQKGCHEFFKNGLWYSTGAQHLMWWDSETLARGPNLATAADFSSADSADHSSPPKVGEFVYEVPGGAFIKDPIEARIMAGQDGDNEEIGIAVMEIEVYGCPLSSTPVCGDGIITEPEICDLGTSSDATNLNSFDSTICDHACTSIKPPLCHYIGSCPPDPPTEVQAQEGYTSDFVPDSELPKWVTIEDVNYDHYFKACTDFTTSSTCETVDESLIDLRLDCLGGDMLMKYNGALKKNMCSPDLKATTIKNHYDPFKMLVKGPNVGNTNYAAVKGRVVTSGRGAPDAFMNVENLRYDWSSYACQRGSDICVPQATAGIQGDMTENSNGPHGYRCLNQPMSDPSFDCDSDVQADPGICTQSEYMTRCCACGGGLKNSIDGRYMDGLSLTTTRTESSTAAREHIFSLAAGATRTPLFSADTDNFASYANEGNVGLEVFEKCWEDSRPTNARGCFLGNCRCHGVADLHDEFEAALGETGLFTPPSFVGNDYYCDSTTSIDEAYYGPWKSKLMFTSEDDICVGGELKDKAWWDAQGLEPGEFRKDLGFLTQSPVEIRVLHGHDTLYEGVAIMSVKLEVCACPEKGWDGKPITQKECIDRCDNPDLKPPANYTTIIVVSVVTVIVFFVIAALAKGYLNEQKLVKTHESKIVALKKSIQMLQQYNESEKQMIEEQIVTFRKNVKDAKASAGTTDSKAVDAALQKLLINAKDLVTEECIGKGAFGEVFKASYRGSSVAVKTMKTVEIDALDRFREEILLMADLHHPNIVTMIGACWEKDLMALVMEFCEKGTASDVLKANGTDFTWDDPLYKWVLDMARAVGYLHSVAYFDTKSGSSVHGILHRDMKPDNCLVTETFSLKVADFGESRAVMEEETMTQVGTPLYIAPEIVMGEHYDSKCDVYSFAITTLGMALKGQQTLTEFLHQAWAASLGPEGSDKRKKAMGLQRNSGRISHKMIAKGWRPSLKFIKKELDMPEAISSLLLLCWDADPAQRPTALEISKYMEMDASKSTVKGLVTEDKGGRASVRRTSTSSTLAFRIAARKREHEAAEMAKEVAAGDGSDGTKTFNMNTAIFNADFNVKLKELTSENERLLKRNEVLERLLKEQETVKAEEVLPGQIT